MDHSIFPEALSLLGLQNISLLIACLTSYASFFYFADSSISPQLSSDIGPQVPLPFVSFLPVLSPLAILSILMDVNAINRLMLRSYIFKVKLFPKLQVYKTNCHLDILDKYKNWTFNLYSRYVHLILLFISVYENCILSTDRVKKKKKTRVTLDSVLQPTFNQNIQFVLPTNYIKNLAITHHFNRFYPGPSLSYQDHKGRSGGGGGE